MHTLGKRTVAEVFGTFVLVLGGCGSAVLAAAFPEVGIGLLGVSCAFGLTVLTMAYTVGPISGCHLNPADEYEGAEDLGHGSLSKCVHCASAGRVGPG